MKKLLCTLALAFFCLMLAPRQAQAQYCGYGVAYGTSYTWQSGSSVYFYSSTELDYCAGLYYDPATYGRYSEGNFATENTRLLADGYTEGYADWIPAEIYYSYGSPINNQYYNTDTTHYVLEYYQQYACFYGCGYYWYDPWGWGFAEGGYGGPSFYGYGGAGYWSVRRRRLGNTWHTIQYRSPGCQPGQNFDSNGNPCQNPTPTPTPPQCSSHTVQLVAAGSRDISNSSGNALIGALVTLQAVVDGTGAEANGIYRWDFGGGQEGAVSTQTIKNVYWSSQGAKTVRLEFTPAGESCTSSMTATVNVVLPTLESYTALQTNASIHSGAGCASFGTNLGQTAFQLGCGTSQPGIKFDATVRGPSDLISIPGDSKIKFVQFFNSYATAHTSSGHLCALTRASEFDTTSGWRRDGNDPYGLVPPAPFSEGGVAVSSAVDSPGYAIESFDYFRNNDYFEMYLVYITGDSLNPRYQQVLSMVPWNWGGEIFFSSPGVWSSYIAYPPSQTRLGVAPNNRVYNPGDPTDVDWSSCSGGPTPEPTPYPEPEPDPEPCYGGGWQCPPVYDY